MPETLSSWDKKVKKSLGTGPATIPASKTKTSTTPPETPNTFAIGAGMRPGPTVEASKAAEVLGKAPTQLPDENIASSFLTAFPKAALSVAQTAKTVYQRETNAPVTAVEYKTIGGRPFQTKPLVFTSGGAPGTGQKPNEGLAKLSEQMQPETVFGGGKQEAKKFGLGETGQTGVGFAAVGLGLADLLPMLPGGAEKAAAAKGVSEVDDILHAGQQFIKASSKEKSTIDGLLTEVYDRALPINKMMQKAEKVLGRTLKPEENSYIATRLFSGAGGKVQQFTKQLEDILIPAGKLVKSGDVDGYLFAQRALERAKRGISNPGGLTAEGAADDLAKRAMKLGPEAWAKVEETASKMYTYGNNLLDYAERSHLISAETKAKILSQNEHYTPFDILEHLVDNFENVPANRRAFNLSEQTAIKAMRGARTESLADSPINAFLRKTIKIVDQGERNLVAKSLGDLSITLGEDAKDLIKVLKKDELAPAGFEKISYLDNGMKKAVAVPKDVGEVLKKLNVKQVDIVTKMAAMSSSLLRSGATGLNAAFIIPNAWRDYQTATLVSKTGFSPKDWGKGFWESLKATANELGFKNVDDSLYRQYLQDGGGMSGYYSTYLTEIPKTAADLTKSKAKRLLELANPLKAIGTAGEIIERAPRLGVYSKALTQGEGRTGAAFASREATVDFAKMGDTTKIYNMWVPFLNARLQGTVNLTKSLVSAVKEARAGNPAKLAGYSAKVAALGVAPAVSTYYWNKTKFPEIESKIANYVKNNYFYVIYGNEVDEGGNPTQVVKIPKGDMGVFTDPVTDILDWVYDKNPNLFSSLAKDFISNLSPVSINQQGTPVEMGKQALGGLLPPIVKGGVESATNYSFFKGRPIVPQGMAKVSPTAQSQGYTPYAAVKLGQLTGMSPLKIENFVQDVFGGLGGQALGVLGTRDKPGLTATPITSIGKRFLGATGGEDVRQSAIEQDVAKYTEEGATRQFMQRQLATKIVKQLFGGNMTEEDKDQMLKDIQENPELIKSIKDVINKQKKGRTYVDDSIAQIPPKERAQLFYDNITDMTPDERAEYAAEWIQKGLLSDETKTNLLRLLTQNQ